MAVYVRTLAPSDGCKNSEWLAAWDAVLAVALAQPPLSIMASIDALSTARSHPTGILTLALIERLLPATIDPDSGLPTALTERAELLLADGSQGANPARAILATRLFACSVADHAWSAQHILPLLEWDNPDTARNVWQGYLSDARVDEVLGRAIAPALLDACSHWDELSPFNRSLCGLVVALGSDAKGVLADRHVRRALILPIVVAATV